MTLAQIWLIALIVKLALSAWLPMSADEAYYWVWSHNPQWNYYDHPAGVSWLFWLGRHVLGDMASTSRWPAVILAHVSLWIWVDLLKPYFDSSKLRWFLVLACLSPIVGPGSLIVTPDLPMIFFWTLGIWVVHRYLTTEKPVLLVLLGLVLGFGFIGKYVTAIFLPIGLLALAFHRKLTLKSLPWILLGFVGFLVGSFPVWLWNLQNDWASFRFQLDHGLGEPTYEVSWTVEYLLGQAAIAFPTVLFAAWMSIKRKAPAWLIIFSLGPIVFFFLTSFKGNTEANWPVTAHLPLLVLALWGSTKYRWAKASAVIWGLALILVLAEVQFRFLPDPKSKLKTAEFHKYDQILENWPQQGPVFARTYQMASKLSFERRHLVYKLRGMNRHDEYDRMDGSMPKTNTFVLIRKTYEAYPKWMQERGFDVLERQELDRRFEFAKVHLR